MRTSRLSRSRVAKTERSYLCSDNHTFQTIARFWNGLIYLGDLMREPWVLIKVVLFYLHERGWNLLRRERPALG